jgi:hypothetical protein
MHANTVDSCVMIVAQYYTYIAVLSSGGVCIVTCDVYSDAGAQILRVPVWYILLHCCPCAEQTYTLLYKVVVR